MPPNIQLHLHLHPPALQPALATSPSRSCHSIFDPKRNALALAVVADYSGPSKTQNFSAVSERSLYLANAINLHPARRSLITRSYEIFTSLQQVAAMCPDDGEDGIDHDLSRVPTPNQMKYFWRIAEQYVVSLRDYLAELEDEEEANAEELDVVIQMIEAFSLFVIVHVPADGRGDGIFAEQFLDWVNRSNPQPPKQEGEELSSLAVPYEHVNYWPYIHACVIRGHLAQAIALLVPYTKTPNATLNHLTTVTLSLLRSTPRSTGYTHESSFVSAVQEFRNQVEQLLSNLDDEMDIISRHEAKRHDGMGEDELLEFQASFKILLDILAGDEQRVSEACYDWKEAIAAHLLWVHPTCKRDGLGPVLKTVTQNWPTDPTSLSDRLTSSILSGDAHELVTLAASLDPWLACHLSDLLSKLGGPDSIGARLRDFHVFNYVETLSVDQGLWRIMVQYCDTTSSSAANEAGSGSGEGKEWIRQIVRRLRVFRDFDGVDGDKCVGIGVGMVELKEVCAKFGIEEEIGRSAKIMARNLVKERKYGAAVAYAVAAGDLKMISRISDLLLDEYITHGPEEFARLVDEIPNSLLHPKAPTIRPGLFFDSSTNQDSPQQQQQQQQTPNLNSSRLVFLSRYRDMHSYYARGDRKLAAETLVGLLTSEIAPKQWWAVCLIDVVPLLEDEEMLVGLPETYELLRCLEAVIGDETYLGYLKRIVGGGSGICQSGEDHLGLVRYALSRNLARCLTCKY